MSIKTFQTRVEDKNNCTIIYELSNFTLNKHNDRLFNIDPDLNTSYKILETHNKYYIDGSIIMKIYISPFQ